MTNPKHDRGEHFLTTPKAAPFLERLIFNNRVIILILFTVLTLFLGYNAVKIQPDASFERMIPLEHPYIVNMLEHRDDLENLGNFVRIAVATKDGSDIFTEEYMETLRQITDEVFYLSGVDRSGLKSLWTPNVRWVEVTEQGFQGGTIIPDNYDGSSAESLEKLRQNVLRSSEVGRLISDNFRSTIVYAPLYENDPQTGEPLDYADFSRRLE
ncbi:MAG TPA: RND family transporter, partial [Marinobacter sp.]|nr:RND family transporter [Marinobacter sp.]